MPDRTVSASNSSSTLPRWLAAIYPFSPRRHETPAGAMSYVDEGTGDEAVLMVHGNPTWSFFYRKVILALRDSIRCVAVDHLGCGLSDKPQDYAYTLPNHVANLRALVERLGVRKIHLIVHDWGGPIGLGAMLPQPEKLGKVVILNTAAFADSAIPWRIRACRAPVVGELLVRGLNGFAGPATHMAVSTKLPDPVRDGFLFPYGNWADRIAVHRFVRDIPSGKGTPSDVALATIESALPILRERSVRIIWGGRDFCFNRHYFDRWRQILPEARADYLAEAGHYLIEDAGDQVISGIREHLGL
jgi:haloalkane dehalogenase